MSLYTEITILAQIYGDSAKENRLDELNIPKHVVDTLELESGGRLSLAASASDIEFEFQSVTNGQLLVLKSASEFTVKINGIGNPALTLMPQTNTEDNTVTPAFLVLLGSGITSLHFGNPSISDAITIDVAIAGV